tara:strand:- start:333 stop:485 length:153 start_codon:yes stop_codon:yes gene_type:complete
MKFDKKLLEVLCCPDDKSDLEHDNNTLKCKKCKRVFKIKEGIPVMLPKNF